MPFWPSYTPTRIEPLGLAQIEPGLWRFVDPSDGRHASPAAVGPFYIARQIAESEGRVFKTRTWPTLAEAEAAVAAWKAEHGQ